MEHAQDISRHPCFNAGAKGSYGRVHLPVAPKCNLGCNYCNRKYDCVNESRPGVTSAVLAPHQAAAYLGEALAREGLHPQAVRVREGWVTARWSRLRDVR
jgi:nitrogen fixation protein NifB